MIPTRPPTLVRYGAQVDETHVRDTLRSMEERAGSFGIQVQQWTDGGDSPTIVHWRRADGRYDEVHAHLADVLLGDTPPAAGMAAHIAAGVIDALTAARDPRRLLDHRTSEADLAKLVCHAFSTLHPAPPGIVVDTVEVLMPSPWSGLRTTRIAMPPFSSGVTSSNFEFRTETRIAELSDRVDAAIAPTAFLTTEHGGRTSRCLKVHSGLLQLARFTQRADAVETLRNARALNDALAKGLTPMEPVA